MSVNSPAVISRLRSICGETHVLTSAADVARYSRCTIPWDKQCSSVVFPGAIEEVQQIVRLANELGFTLWTFGRGKNWGYGTTCALEAGAVIMILERLNAISEVNEDLAYAVVGPGTSYGELNQYLKEKRIKLWADCTDSTPEGSVVGNALERGQGYTQNGDHFGSLCGMQVVLPDGKLVTLGGGPPNSHVLHTYKYGSGPYLDGLFSQSNLGIVVRSGVWLMPEPEKFYCFTCEVRDESAYPDVIDSIRRLALDKTITSNVHMINAFMGIALAFPYPYDRLEGRRNLSETQLRRLREELHLAAWMLSGGIYGPKEQVAINKRRIAKEFSRYGKVNFVDDRKAKALETLLNRMKNAKRSSLTYRALTTLKNTFISKSPEALLGSLLKFYPVFKGIPGTSSLDLAYTKRRAGGAPSNPDPARDNCGLIWFAPVAPMSGSHTRTVINVASSLFEKHGFDLSLVFVYLNPRSVMVLMQILYDKKNAEESARAIALYDEVAAATTKAGYPQYRTSLAYMDRILGESGSFRALAQHLKSALDPQGVLSPGRYGLESPAPPVRKAV